MERERDVMRALFGAVSLLVVLAIVGILAVKQMTAVSSSVGSAGQSAAASGAAAVPPAPSTTNVREQSRQLQQRVKDDVTKALEQGAAARQEEPTK
jgi:hypothetical protein